MLRNSCHQTESVRQPSFPTVPMIARLSISESGNTRDRRHDGILVTFKIEEGSCLWRTPFELWNTGTVKDFTLEYQKVNGENVTVIKKEEIETPRYRGRTFFTTIKLGAKGHFISGEERIEQGGQNELVSTSETIYVYNPKDLKIEAPAIK